MTRTLASYGSSRRLVLSRAGLLGPEPAAVPFAAPQTVSLLPQSVHLEIYQGDDVWLELTCTDPDGQPSELAGAVALSQIRGNPDGPVLAEFDPSISGAVITLHLPTAQSSELTAGRGVWDAQISESGQVTTLVAGTVIIVPEVSR